MTSPSPSLEASTDPSPSLNPFETPESPSMFSEPAETLSPNLSSPSPSSSPDDSPSPSSVGAGSSTTRSAEALKYWKQRRSTLRPQAEKLLTTIGDVAHKVLTRADSIERQLGLYLPDTEDVEAIADPLAGLASRRLPEGPENPDFSDLIALGLGVAGYVTKQLGLRRQLAAHRAYLAANEPVDHTPGPGETEVEEAPSSPMPFAPPIGA